MSAEETDFSEFDRAYQGLLAKVWGDEAALAALLADPKQFAVEAGLPIDPAATVTVGSLSAAGWRPGSASRWCRPLLRLRRSPAPTSST